MPQFPKAVAEAELKRALAAYVQDAVGLRDIPALAMGISDRSGIGATAPSFDLAFRVASVTKLLTAVATLRLRDAGGIDLDASLSTALPAVHSTIPRTATVRQLLAHLGGFPRDWPLPYWTEQRFPPRSALSSLALDPDSVRPPGSEARYSNVGYALVGEILASRLGIDPAGAVNELVVRPLGLTHTALDPLRPPGNDFARGYGRRMTRDGDRAETPVCDLGILSPAGGAWSTVSDLLRLGRAVLDDASFLSARSRSELFTVHAPTADGGGFGLGCHIQGTNAAIQGATLGYQSMLLLDVRDGRVSVALTNATDANAALLAQDALCLLEPRHQDGSDADWLEAEGLYRGTMTDVRVATVAGTPCLYWPMNTRPLATRLPLAATSTGWRVGWSALSPFAGEPVTFDRGADGRVARLRIGAEYWIRT